MRVVKLFVELPNPGADMMMNKAKDNGDSKDNTTNTRIFNE